MENKEILVGILAIVGGLFCVLACLFDWDFFFESRKARFFVNIFGRKGARIFCTLLGLVMFVISFQILTK